jgi:hypothetical protein
LEGIGELKRVNISKPILDMGVDDKLCQAKNFSTQVESIPKTRLLLLFRSKRPKSQSSIQGNYNGKNYELYGFQVHIVVEVQVVQVLKAPS